MTELIAFLGVLLVWSGGIVLGIIALLAVLSLIVAAAPVLGAFTVVGILVALVASGFAVAASNNLD